MTVVTNRHHRWSLVITADRGWEGCTHTIYPRYSSILIDSPWITPFSGQLQPLHDRKHGHPTAHSLLSSTPFTPRGPLSSKLLPSPSYHDMGEITINPKACVQLSLSSSIISVRIRAAFNGPTMVLSIWEQRDFRPVLGLALRTRSNFPRNGRYR